MALTVAIFFIVMGILLMVLGYLFLGIIFFPIGIILTIIAIRFTVRRIISEMASGNLIYFGEKCPVCEYRFRNNIMPMFSPRCRTQLWSASPVSIKEKEEETVGNAEPGNITDENILNFMPVSKWVTMDDLFKMFGVKGFTDLKAISGKLKTMREHGLIEIGPQNGKMCYKRI
ncbi:MAG TPA: hypothetical protein VKM55_28235 [Candidatus Lokiarchaeia archaeon]|nr:hypothetical protein [Candidatus Lokiarchaeia archaeon]